MNIRRKFRVAQIAVMIFFLYAFFSALTVFWLGLRTLPSVCVIAIVFSLPLSIWVFSSIDRLEEDDDFYLDYEELLKEKERWEKLVKEERGALMIIGEHEAFKGYKYSEEEGAWIERANSEQSPERSVATEGESSTEADNQK